MLDIERLRFLMQHYRQWSLSSVPGESLLVDREDLVLSETSRGVCLLVDHPRLSFRKKIFSIRTEKGGRCLLQLQGRSLNHPEVLVLTPREVERLGSETTLRRERFRRWVTEALTQMFPGAKIRGRGKVSGSGELPAAGCVRFEVQRDAAKIAAIAVDPGVKKNGIHRALSSGLIWYRKLAARTALGGNVSLALILPRVFRRDAPRILKLMNPAQVRYVLYIFSGKRHPYVLAAGTDDAGAASSSPARWPRPGAYRCSALLVRVFESYPGHFRRFPRAGGGSSLRVLGLEVLRTHTDEESPVYLGPPDFGRVLNEHTWPDFSRLMDELLRVRRYNSPDKQHPFYRWQTERWLEEIMLSQIDRLDPGLDPRFTYSQVPAYQGDQRAVVDLLGINHKGRLVVIELKVDRDPDLLMQALDYWDRVHRHNLNNDFGQRGYFEGVKLSKEKPLLYLVAPVLGFDRRIDEQGEMVDGSVEIFKISVGRNWRQKLTVVRREPINR